MRGLFGLACLAACASEGAEDEGGEESGVVDSGSPVEQVSLREDVLPVVQEHCGFCHTRTGSPSAGAVENEVYWERRNDMLGTVGELIVAGSASDSDFMAILRGNLPVGDGPTVMPPPSARRPDIPRREVRTVGDWIDQGALDN